MRFQGVWAADSPGLTIERPPTPVLLATCWSRDRPVAGHVARTPIDLEHSEVTSWWTVRVHISADKVRATSLRYMKVI